MRMFNPPHPGSVLRDYLGDVSVTDAATHLRVTRAALSRILNGSAGISADMAVRLSGALGTSPELWAGMQSGYELWQALQRRQNKIAPLERNEGVCKEPPLGRNELKEQGFDQFLTVSDVASGAVDKLPRRPGTFVVLRESCEPPAFLECSPAGHFKGKDPTVPREVLERKWVDGSHLLYIGQTTDQDLRTRLHDFVEFGRGRRVGHWGGRLTWQVDGADKFCIGWREDENPRDAERELLTEFRDIYGKLPFANLRM
jgi:addiction module HigA family antidote